MFFKIFMGTRCEVEKEINAWLNEQNNNRYHCVRINKMSQSESNGDITISFVWEWENKK